MPTRTSQAYIEVWGKGSLTVMEGVPATLSNTYVTYNTVSLIPAYPSKLARISS
jgi:hypothetical protein